jgi:hypothetical protein
MKVKILYSFSLLLVAGFVAAILFAGKYSPTSPELITIHIDGVENHAIADKIEDIFQMLDGVQAVIVDDRTNLCTVRYDSGKISLQALESKLANMGIKFLPLEEVNILEPNLPKEGKKLFSVKINSAADY